MFQVFLYKSRSNNSHFRYLLFHFSWTEFYPIMFPRELLLLIGSYCLDSKTILSLIQCSKLFKDLFTKMKEDRCFIRCKIHNKLCDKIPHPECMVIECKNDNNVICVYCRMAYCQKPHRCYCELRYFGEDDIFLHPLKTHWKHRQ